MKTNNEYTCDSYVRNESDPNCVCRKATHGGWKFGRNKHFINPENEYEYDSCHFYSFK